MAVTKRIGILAALGVGAALATPLVAGSAATTDAASSSTVAEHPADLTDEQLQALGLTEDDLPEIEAEFAQVLTADETGFLRTPDRPLRGILDSWFDDQPLGTVPSGEPDGVARWFDLFLAEISETVARADGEADIRDALISELGPEIGDDEAVVDLILDAYGEQILALDALEQRYRPELNPIQAAAWYCDIDPDGNVEFSSDGTAAVLRLGEILRMDDQECMLDALDVPLFALESSGAYEFDEVTMNVDDDAAVLVLR
jgi:hypothetical protein